MFYGTTIQSLKKGKIVDDNGTLLHKLADMKLTVGDMVWTDGNVIFGDVFEGTQLTGFRRSGVPVLGELPDEKIRGYVKRHGEYKKYPIAEGTFIINNRRMYFHADGENYLDVEIAISEDSEVGYYSAHTTGERIYEATLYGRNISGDSTNELVLELTPTDETSKELCRVPLRDLLTDIIDWINAKVLDAKERYAEYVNGTDFRLLIEPIMHLTAKLNNLKISPQRAIDMLYSTTGNGVLRLLSNWRELSSRKYSRKEFFDTKFAFELEENGGHPQLKKALITLWDYWVCHTTPPNIVSFDIYSDRNDQIHNFEVTTYQRIKPAEMDSDTSDCITFADLPLETSQFVQIVHDAPSGKIDATLSEHELLSNKVLLHRAEKTSEAIIKTGQVDMRRIVTHPDAHVWYFDAFVICYDDGKSGGGGSGVDSSGTGFPEIFGFKYKAEDGGDIYEEFRSGVYREIPSPVMAVRILPYVIPPYLEYLDMDYNAQPSADLNNPTLIIRTFPQGKMSIGWASSDDVERWRIGTGFVFFEGSPTAMFQNLFPLTDEYAYRFIITDNNPDYDDPTHNPAGITHRHEVMLCISGDFVYSETWQRPLEEEENKSEFTFPVQDEYVAKYKRTPIDGEMIVAEEKLWTMTGIYDSDTKICNSVPPQFDQSGEERSSTDYNLAVSPLGVNAANGYLVGVHNGKLYRHTGDFKEVCNGLKNFRLREMKNVAKAKR